MKKLTTRLMIGALLIMFFSCSKKRELENTFITQQNEYWDYNDNCEGHGNYFRFNKDGSHDKYNGFIDGSFELFNNDGDVISGPRTWSIKDDSTFVWDKEEYKIESCNKKKIILSYYHYKEKNKKCTVILTKVIALIYKR